MNLDELSQYIPGSHNYGHSQKNIAPLIIAGIAAAGFVKSGGLDGIIGGKKRNAELAKSTTSQRQAEYDYKNFDYNQDVGAISNPYRDNIVKTQRYNQERIDRAGANQINAQQNAGNFGAVQNAFVNQVDATQRSSQQISGLRQQGATYVEQQRQSRIQDKFDQAGTFLGRADHRLATAKRAKTQAKQALVKGIAGGATAAISGGLAGAAGGGAFDASAALKGSGLFGAQNSAAVGELDLQGSNIKKSGFRKQQRNFNDLDFNASTNNDLDIYNV